MKRIGLLVAAVLWLIALAAPTAWANPKPIKVRFISGPQPFTQPKVKLHVNGTKVVLVGKCGKKRQSYEIPLETVTFVAHSPVRFNRAGQVAKTVPNADVPRLGACSGMGCAGNILVIFAWGAYEVGRGTAIGVAATQHGKQHFITMDWREGDLEYELQFEAGKSDYLPLIKQLESASGKKAFDFEARWKQAQSDIEREKSHAESVALEKLVRVGELSLPRATYNLVSIKHQGDSGEVYFFEGTRMDSTALRAIAPVTFSEPKLPATSKQAEVDYTETAPIQIREIRTATRTLTFVASAPAAKPEIAKPEKDASPAPQQ